ncbi:SDR family NAD(P)-dependent oxidoreductase [Parasphingorhabdus halotolerans]|uniref:SDR family oxidoreductase n=1 Tax=Parasphingorhabdus halotolerans TaxID=2725558 RepID=A0A6H2DP10_9SPHN|nr:SDR family oxidoreductase [Parasphingorhabdus halotolerans]QJB69491.1 SDR family oxidoreductase [Parasphingorhabdus halotolerans]
MGILDNFKLDGQVAVVVGAGKGIGRAIALGFAEAGADVAVAARTAGDLESLVAEIQAMGRKAIAVPTDATNVDALENLAKATVDQLGKVTIWVSNAGGIPDGQPRYLTRTSEAEWDAQINLNLKGVWMGAVVATKYMGEDGGVIINTSSRAAMGGQPKNGPYGAAKAGVNSLTSTLAMELAPKIRVNAVAPGPVPTENFDDCMGTETEEQRQQLLKMMQIPLQRYGTEEDIAAAAIYMASPASSWVTGQCLYVTGGR